MAKVSKKRQAVNAKIDATKLYALRGAAALVKEINTTKFDASVDVHVRLGVDPRNEGLSEYARKLLSPIDYKPRQPLSSGEVLLSVSGLGKKYKSGNFRLFGEEKKIIALEGVSFELKKGEMLGILGPSGSGKSTLARIITGLEEATSGKVVCQNKVLKVRAFEQDKHLRRQIQYVFQDPFSVFDPLQSFGDALIEVLKAHKMGEHAARINRVLNLMSLPEDILKRYTSGFRRPETKAGFSPRFAVGARVTCF